MSSRLDAARSRIRRFQLVVGVGFCSCVVGLLLSLAVASRVNELSASLSRFAPLQLAIAQLWELAVLPVAFYGVARVVDLAPWRTGIGGVLTGELFLAALAFLTGHPWLDLSHPLTGAMRIGFMALGAYLSATAIRRARAAAARSETAARVAAEEKKTQYDEFVREAERIAALREAPAAAADTTGGTSTSGDGSGSSASEVASGGSASGAADGTAVPVAGDAEAQASGDAGPLSPTGSGER